MKSRVGVNYSMLEVKTTYKVTLMVEISTTIVNSQGAKAAIDGMVRVVEKAAEEYLEAYANKVPKIQTEEEDQQ